MQVLNKDVEQDIVGAEDDVDKDGALSADAKAVCAAMGLTEEEFKAAGAAGGKS